MEILGALNSVPVKRLAQTWEGISKKEMKMIEYLRDLMNHESNFGNYRRHLDTLRDLEEPMIPFIGTQSSCMHSFPTRTHIRRLDYPRHVQLERNADHAGQRDTHQLQKVYHDGWRALYPLFEHLCAI